ncbi:MAG TPA: hypothetical protein VKU40_18815 [Thermoanaerobaculia bacterium]|nr:hypothetical protein [Thermoanaerobaculia bacterium]
MPEDKDRGLDEAVGRANAEANEAFASLAKHVERYASKGGTLDVAEVCEAAGLDVDAKVLATLHLDRVIHVHPWLPWHYWFPWRPLWCWWWRRRYPWYYSCPWWWTRCHWRPSC